jgi:hypothetical protein
VDAVTGLFLAVSNIAKLCSVMAFLQILSDISSLVLALNLGLENVAIHPNPDRVWWNQQHRLQPESRFPGSKIRSQACDFKA